MTRQPVRRRVDLPVRPLLGATDQRDGLRGGGRPLLERLVQAALVREFGRGVVPVHQGAAQLSVGEQPQPGDGDVRPSEGVLHQCPEVGEQPQNGLLVEQGRVITELDDAVDVGPVVAGQQHQLEVGGLLALRNRLTALQDGPGQRGRCRPLAESTVQPEGARAGCPDPEAELRLVRVPVEQRGEPGEQQLLRGRPGRAVEHQPLTGGAPGGLALPGPVGGQQRGGRRDGPGATFLRERHAAPPARAPEAAGAVGSAPSGSG
ncbi:hypothetical protein SMICM17S_03070 [Streptomyces microflavus]